MSAQFYHLQNTLYPEVKRMLACARQPIYSGQNLATDVELVQAWILVATYEFVKANHHEACISAGRAFRLAQLMGLHEVDLGIDAASAGNVTETDFIVTEEKRRAFWMAFTLESLCSMRNNLPLTVSDHTVSAASRLLRRTTPLLVLF